MPSYKTLYTKSQARVEKLTDLVINSNEKTVVLIDEIGHLRTELAKKEEKLSALSTELADTKVKLAELALNNKPVKK
jgi:alpha-D-ribose 1-methylphosphonate 5-triphosphate diphosphatase PhnM